MNHNHESRKLNTISERGENYFQTLNLCDPFLNCQLTLSAKIPVNCPSVSSLSRAYSFLLSNLVFYYVNIFGIFFSLGR